jgi:hypothetical protein
MTVAQVTQQARIAATSVAMQEYQRKVEATTDETTRKNLQNLQATFGQQGLIGSPNLEVVYNMLDKDGKAAVDAMYSKVFTAQAGSVVTPFGSDPSTSTAPAADVVFDLNGNIVMPGVE